MMSQSDIVTKKLYSDAACIAEARDSRAARGTLVLTGLMILALAGVYFMNKRTGAATVSAAVVKEQVAAKNTISTFLKAECANIKSMELTLRNTENVVRQFQKYPSMTQIPLSDLKTNPFRAKAANPTTVALGEVAEKNKREEERQLMLKAVQQLHLQSIMFSDARSACMINNTMQREGEVVDNFTVERINPSTVIVRNAAYRFELKIQR